VGKFTWHRLVRLLGPGVIPPHSVLRDVIHEIEFEAAEDGADIRPGDVALSEWTGAHLNSVAAAWRTLAALGLVHREYDARGPGRGGGPGRVAVWSLTMRAEHWDRLEAAGWVLAMQAEGSRKYVHARKSSTSQTVGDSLMTHNRGVNDPQPGLWPPKEVPPQGRPQDQNTATRDRTASDRGGGRSQDQDQDLGDEERRDRLADALARELAADPVEERVIAGMLLNDSDPRAVVNKILKDRARYDNPRSPTGRNHR
jgi:hypothetical protein